MFTSCCVQQGHNTFTHTLPFAFLSILIIALQFLAKSIVTISMTCKYGYPEASMELGLSFWYNALFCCCFSLAEFWVLPYFFPSDLSMPIYSFSDNLFVLHFFPLETPLSCFYAIFRAVAQLLSWNLSSHHPATSLCRMPCFWISMSSTFLAYSFLL